MLSTLKNTAEELRLLGFRGTLFRVGYEALQRSGVRPVIEPVDKLPELSPLIFKADWFEGLDESGLAGRWAQDVRSGEAGQVLRQILGRDDLKALEARAAGAVDGKIRIFSNEYADYGSPVDWHRNPKRGVSWPADIHWSKIYGFGEEGGDIKLVWELNRFPHIYDWGRTYAIEVDGKWARAFAAQLESWERANPFRAGANWASGQEVAIRVIAWVFGLATLGTSDSFENDDFQRLVRLVELQGYHLERHIGYARWAVHNNHLIGEALGLLLIGAIFPHLNRAEEWAAKGREILLGPCIDQFYEDGGYCQSSHTYHRLALHYLLWARWFVEGEDRETLDDLLSRSADYLLHFQNGEDGRLPNWGANDGACLNPWTECDYGDFRPVIGAIKGLTEGRIPYESGPWDEEIYWFGGKEVLEASREKEDLGSRSFSYSGLHILREDANNFAVLRCGDLRDRFGQADQLHVDLWGNGENIAVDGGSYLYNDELRYHRYFMGSSSHNTVTVDDKDQMLLYRRFKWLYWANATSSLVDGEMVEGSHDGYDRDGIIHRRRLENLADVWQISDLVDVKPAGVGKEIALRWHLNKERVEISAISTGVWEVSSGEGSLIAMKLIAEYRSSPTATWEVISGELEEETGHDDGQNVAGWISRYYASKQPVATLVARVRAKVGQIRLRTQFFKPEKSL